MWMAENLKTTKFNGGAAIANITDNAAWAADSVAHDSSILLVLITALLT